MITGGLNSGWATRSGDCETFGAPDGSGWDGTICHLKGPSPVLCCCCRHSRLSCCGTGYRSSWRSYTPFSVAHAFFVQVTLVSQKIQGGAALQEIDEDCMGEAMLVYDAIVRENLKVHSGFKASQKDHGMASCG